MWRAKRELKQLRGKHGMRQQRSKPGLGLTDDRDERLRLAEIARLAEEKRLREGAQWLPRRCLAHSRFRDGAETNHSCHAHSVQHASRVSSAPVAATPRLETRI